MAIKRDKIEIVTERELAQQIEAMRDDPDAWGEPAAKETKSRRKSERRQRGAMVSVRFAPDELAIVQMHAEHAGTSVSGYLRGLALSAAKQPIATSTWFSEVAVNYPGTSEGLVVRSPVDASCLGSA